MQTVDFFTPIVDDPYVYGEIAAANSLSDVYAMGGRPLTALAIAGFPDGLLEPNVISAIFRGGLNKLHEAGVALLGGHTVRDQELKFGYAVTGAIDPERILSNAGAKAGDELFLTKPIGSGIIGTAIKFGRIDDAATAEVIESMRTLNRAAAEALAPLPPGSVHACTDITGFGLIGHASEMAIASDVTIVLRAGAIPVFNGVLDLTGQNKPGGLGSNREYYGAHVSMSGDVTGPIADLLYDPQTSGGLLIAAAEAHAAEVATALAAAGVPAARVGEVRKSQPRVRIEVLP